MDARYETVRIGGIGCDVTVLTAFGVAPDGSRHILGVSVAFSEAEVHWRAFLESLVARGLRGVRFITSDAHAGLNAARKTVLGGATLPVSSRTECDSSLPNPKNKEEN